MQSYIVETIGVIKCNKGNWMKKISVVVPVYAAPESLAELCRRVDDALDYYFQSDYELILVNDGCPKNSWAKIEVLIKKHSNLTGIKLSRNFGQHFAMSAGIDESNGECVVFMDCDLQDRPEDIIQLYEKYSNSDAQVVFARSKVRGEKGFIRQITSKLYYRVYDYLSYNTDRSFNTSFMLMSRDAANAFISMRESKRQFFSLVSYLGFTPAFIDVEHDERHEGDSSYTFATRLQMALKGITTNSTRLLKLGISIGAVFSTLSFFYGLYLIIVKLMNPDVVVLGWTAIMVTIFFASGLIMLLLGILGSYIETIFWEVKQRPYYFIEKKIKGRNNDV
jgi:glycosyltransferase involved in cell wall biosynthesis